jgi:fructose-1,6-bisphosphatase/inositol monophosphatase family enzyme
VLGVVYVPGTKELYLAVKGYGAYRNGTRIWQSPATSTKTLQTAIVCCEFGYAREKEYVDRMLTGLSRVMQSRCRAVRQLGSGCLDLCLVASGRLDVVYAGLATEGWKVGSVWYLCFFCTRSNKTLTYVMLVLVALGLCCRVDHLSRGRLCDGVI